MFSPVASGYMQNNRLIEGREMRTRLKNERQVLDAIWADPFRTGDSTHRAAAIRRGDVSALIRLSIRIGT